jgi:hypothetical protein
MSKRPITRELYDALVAGFRETPGNASHAARVAGCDRRTAARGWTEGWCRQWSWARPINAVLREEQLAARAKAAEAEQAAERQRAEQAEKARTRAIEAAAEEEQVLRVARKDVLGVLVVCAELQPAMRKLGQKVATMVDQDKVTPKEAMVLLTRYSQVIQRATLAGDQVIKLSRLDRGEPTAIEQRIEAEYTPEEAADEIARAHAALERAKKRGLVPAGLNEGKGGEAALPPPDQLN